MRHVEFCPVCGSSPACTIHKRVDLDRAEGILREQYIEYNMKLCGQEVPDEHFAICAGCAAIYRALHFTASEIRAIYTTLYLNFEEKFRGEIIYNDKKLLDGCSARMYEKVKDIEKSYGAGIGTIFDIGGRDGFRLVKLADSGYDCAVYDPIPQASCSKEIVKRNIWANELREDEKADLIVMCNVLEHSPDPRSLINDCYSHLDDDGFLFLEIPVDFDAFFDWLLCYQLFKKPLGIDVTHHVFFSKRAITALLREGRFTVKHINYNRLPVCGVKVMEILAQKDSDSRAPLRVPYSVDNSRYGSNTLFFLASLAKVFPRVALSAADRCCRRAIKFLLKRGYHE